MLALALILDSLFGEPDRVWSRVPHPAVLMGRAVAWLDRSLNTGHGRRARGVVAVLALGAGAWLAGRVLAWDGFGGVFEVLGAAILLAHRSLIDHVRAVAEGLRTSLSEGRKAVALIVGRDPEALDRHGVARAAIESAGENFSDGVVAPAFWFVIAGLPGMLLYKTINTADSMIGHRTDRYLEFGWAAARLDDLLNWAPARISGLLICIAGAGRGAFDVMIRDAPLHRSPNAGWPEAALAASIGVAVAGPRVYDGVPTHDPFVNPEDTPDAEAADIDAACALLWRTWWIVLALAVVFGVIG